MGCTQSQPPKQLNKGTKAKGNAKPASQKHVHQFRRHPSEVEEVALGVCGAFKLSPDVIGELVAEVSAVADALGLTPEAFKEVLKADGSYENEDTSDLLPFMLQHLMIPKSRIDKCLVEELLFSGEMSNGAICVTGGLTEGTNVAEHFIFEDECSVVTGGSGRNVFMFLPKDECSKPHVVTDFNPEEGLLDLRALPVVSLSDITIEPYGPHHCYLSGNGLNVLLLGTHPRQLDDNQFILPESAASPVCLIKDEVREEAQGATTYVFQGTISVDSGPFPNVYVILPNSVQTIRNFKTDDPCDRLDARGINTSSFDDLQIKYEEGSTVVSGDRFKVLLPCVGVSEITEKHFMFSLVPRFELEPSLNPDAFRCLLYWCAHQKGYGNHPKAPGAEKDGVLQKELNNEQSTVTPDTLPHASLQLALGLLPSSSASSTKSSSWAGKMTTDNSCRKIKRKLDKVLFKALNKAFDVVYRKVLVPISEKTVFRVKPKPVPHLCFKPNVDVLLPPKNAKHTYTVVLDLDETLVYSRHLHDTHHMCIRHGVHDLMVMLQQHQCEVVVWSAADAETVHAMWNAVDPTGITAHVLPREAWQRTVYEQCKNLERLGRDLNTTIIIDNTPSSVEGWSTNAIVVRDYLGGPHANDTHDELYALINFLKEMFTTCSDVPAFIASSPELAHVAVKRAKNDVSFNILHHLPLAQTSSKKSIKED